ncbi:MAG TPA: YfiR family protein [Noviherbaspirillum sp.]|nr:YfiR family protein [Noviherbaspirillum sp.]
MGQWLIAAIMLPALPASAQTVQEYDLKAAYVYNFALFTEWPTETVYDGGTFNICVGSASAVRTALVSLGERSIRGRKIAVRNLGAADNPQNCQVVFLESADRERWTHIKKGLGSGVLTISDDEETGRGSAVIALAMDGNRVVFDIDTRAARQAKLVLSSKLLRLARTVQ